ncbi:MerR family transcriptional regulator [Pseudomonas sp. SDI]|uniref:MerR family transcriptional regulator n=1 Tax=Pseudomonas sp. SDI TaxID=2170734 RepID=UPI000DE6FCE1|nr:MerR family transcriptional regulator [Pseudomonas sp. SDI]PWB35189.1 MerR family transcriptional regulator [Pseudomonas sp. SDI]
MKIGELAKLSGMAASRIRYYEASGLLSAIARKANGYREYGSDALWMLKIIACAQSAGFSLEEIRTLLPASAASWEHGALLDGLKRKVSEIDILQQQLAHNRAQLLAVIDGIENRPNDRQCADNAQWLLERLHEEAAQPRKV